MNLVERENGEVSINIWGVVQLLWSKALFIIFCSLALGVLTYAGTYLFVTPQYKATLTLYVNNSSSGENSTNITSSDLTASAKLVDTYSAIIKSDTMLEDVIVQAEVDMTTEELAGLISTAAVNDTEVFKVSVLNSDAKAAARIANAIADVAPAQIAAIVEGSSVKIIDYAKIPTSISSPSYIKRTFQGAGIGFMVCCIFLVIQALMDTSIKNESELERWNLPVLGTVPDLLDASASKNQGYGYGYKK